MAVELAGERREPRAVERREQGGDARQPQQAVPQRDEVARARRAERDTREDALEIAERAQAHAQRFLRGARTEHAERVRTRAERRHVA